jgi:hypothetical protein
MSYSSIRRADSSRDDAEDAARKPLATFGSGLPGRLSSGKRATRGEGAIRTGTSPGMGTGVQKMSLDFLSWIGDTPIGDRARSLVNERGGDAYSYYMLEKFGC